MMAKMRVRRFLLQELENANNFSLLSQSLWNKDIFPKDSFTTLRFHNKNALDLSRVLRISPRAIIKNPSYQGPKTAENIRFDQGFSHPKNDSNNRGNAGYQNRKQKSLYHSRASQPNYNKSQTKNKNPQQRKNPQQGGWQNKNKGSASSNTNPQPTKQGQGKSFQKKDNSNNKQ